MAPKRRQTTQAGRSDMSQDDNTQRNGTHKRARSSSTRRAKATTTTTVPAADDGAQQQAALLAALQTALQDEADEETRVGISNYIKGGLFRGLKMPPINSTVKRFLAGLEPGQLESKAERHDLAFELMRQPHHEDKLAGMMILQQSKALPDPADLPRLLEVFEQNHLSFWNLCDGLCSKVLHPMVRKHGEPLARDLIVRWRASPNLWARRATCVTFVNAAKRGDNGNFAGFAELMLETALICLQAGGRDAAGRFAQTGAGWMLRGLAEAHNKAVVSFLETNAGLFSSEGMRYATEKMSPAVRSRLLKLVPRA